MQRRRISITVPALLGLLLFSFLLAVSIAAGVRLGWSLGES